MMRLNRWQGIFAGITFLFLIAATVSIYNTSHAPTSYSKILSDAESMTPVISNTSQDTLNYETVIKQWLKDLKNKSDVEIARATLASDMTVVNLSTNKYVSDLFSAKSLQALTTSDAIIAKYSQEVMPLALGAKLRTQLDPSLTLITNIVTDVFTSNLKSVDVQLRSAIATRQKNLNKSLYVIYLAFFLLLALIFWIGYSFIARVKSIQSSIKIQLTDLEQSRLESEFTFSNLAKFATMVQGQRDLNAVSKNVLSEVAPLVNAQYGAFYLLDRPSGEESSLHMLSSYAYAHHGDFPATWKIGEGLVGQCAFERKTILLTDVPTDYIHITSGLGEAKPLNVIVLPLIFEGQVKGVLELASFAAFTQTHQTFLDQLADSLGNVINTIEINMKTETLLEQSQSLTNELQSQQSELRETNDQLEAKATLLEEQKLEVEAKNYEVEYAKSSLEEKASQLELTSKYKSEFLSNMSHELRTPLNSLLILAQQLVENNKGHLDPKEVEFAKLIETSGNDLLSLINEILDLSKIESGTVTINVSPLTFSALEEKLESTFRPVAKNRKLEYNLTFDHDLPPIIFTDEMRLNQVLKNLLSNSFKFTDKGEVSVHVERVTSGWNPEIKSLNEAPEVYAFTVADTGIGISADKQQIIFEAFQQADGKTARRYGGTGLGLSISREIAGLLGGELKIEKSALQHGSTFVLYVPQRTADECALPDTDGDQPIRASVVSAAVTSTKDSALKITNWVPRAKSETVIVDDRNNIQDGDRTLLIVEDDPIFAKIVLDLAREKDFKAIVSLSGAQALELAHSYRPDAITLDLHIPDIEGWTILNILKSDPELRHIPVDVITVEDDPMRGLSRGALQYLLKPISKVEIVAALDFMRAFIDRPVKNLLLLASDPKEQAALTDLLAASDITIDMVASGSDALAKLQENSFDCVVTTTQLSDMTGTQFVAAMRKEQSLREIPIVLYSAAVLSPAESSTLEKLAKFGVVNVVNTMDHLFEQTALFLHRVVAKLPKGKAEIIHHLTASTNILAGKKVMIVDDDTRNIFALTAALESRGIVVSSAERGATSIEMLKDGPAVDLVLMDIMMPDMDGYETMREIRKLDKFKALPIISLTAKAMVGDRQKCIDAGASDYLSKPVNIVQLSSMMQVWFSKK